MKRNLILLYRHSHEIEEVPVTLQRTPQGLRVQTDRGNVTFMPSQGILLLQGKQIPASVGHRICDIALH